MSDSVSGKMRMDRLIGSIENKVKGIKLFKYTKEIVDMDLLCNIQNYNAFLGHEFTLREIYRNRLTDVDNKDIMDIIYEANMMGSILLITENAGLVIWMPPTLTDYQKQQLFLLINKVNVDNVDICVGCAKDYGYKEFSLINEGCFMTCDETIYEINKIRIDNDCSYLKEYNKDNIR